MFFHGDFIFYIIFTINFITIDKYDKIYLLAQ